MDTIAVFHFAYDGELLGSQSIPLSQLSERWLGVCQDLLSNFGPIFSANLGSTLDRFKIECTAGICTFLVADEIALSAVVLRSAPEQQATAALRTFVAQIGKTKLVANHCADTPAFLKRLESIAERPSLIVINWLNPAIPEQDQAAAFQLALHFAGAYLQW